MCAHLRIQLGKLMCNKSFFCISNSGYNYSVMFQKHKNANTTTATNKGAQVL